tara:strand:+ start:199 stop:525 length:327 start_codon:yes stop_codon:yes gene_type:complete
MSQSSTIILDDEGMSGFTIGDLGVFIGTLGGVITSILIVLQKSKCRKINCCCFSCERDVDTTEPKKKEEKKETEELEDKQKKKEKVNPQLEEIHLTDEEDEGLQPPNP